MANYTDIYTKVQVGGAETSAINITRGVKQGDPLSPVIFNMIMDELLSELDPSLGLPITSDVNVSALAYADDLVLLGPSRTEVNVTLRRCTKFFGRKGLALNIDKCACIATGRVPKRKKLFAITRPQFNVGGVPIPQKGVDSFKYLGQRFSTAGSQRPDMGTLRAQCSRVMRASLKPYQKLWVIKNQLVPRWIHILQNPTVSGNLLREADRNIRKLVRTVCHLPRTCAMSYIHASLKDGGLGIFCLRERIPAILIGRLNNIGRTAGNITGALFAATENLRDRLRRLYKHSVPSSAASARRFQNELHSSWSGNGIWQCQGHQGSSSWIGFPPSNWSGRTFCKALQLRGNLLPTRANPSNVSGDRWCRSGCGKQESLSHILQGCHVTHHQRIQRHDRVVSNIETMARRKGWSVRREPRLALAGGEVRVPDLVLSRGDVGVICDVGIHWEGPRNLESGFQTKIDKYRTEGTLAAVQKIFPHTQISVLPCIIGARGTWCTGNNLLWDTLGLSKSQGCKVISDVILGGIFIHTHFNGAVWVR